MVSAMLSAIVYAKLDSLAQTAINAQLIITIIPIASSVKKVQVAAVMVLAIHLEIALVM
jgi:hypothetical protein